jgi:hypothetical protein
MFRIVLFSRVFWAGLFVCGYLSGGCVHEKVREVAISKPFPEKEATGPTIEYDGLKMVPFNAKWKIEEIDGKKAVVGIGEGKYPQALVIQRPLGQNYTITCETKGFNDYASFLHRMHDAKNFYHSSIRYHYSNAYLKKAMNSMERDRLAESPGFDLDKKAWHKIKIAVRGNAVAFFVNDMEQPRYLHIDKEPFKYGGFPALGIWGTRKTAYRDIKIMDGGAPLLNITPNKYAFKLGECARIKREMFSANGESGTVSFSVIDGKNGKAVMEENDDLECEKGTISNEFVFTPQSSGAYKIISTFKNTQGITRCEKNIYVYGDNKICDANQKMPKLKLLDEVDLTDTNQINRIRHNKKGRISQSKAGKYFESGDKKKMDFVSVDFRINNLEKIHMLEVDYPDDGDRQMTLSVHNSNDEFGNDLGGMPTGIDVPVTNKMKTYRAYFIPRNWPAFPGDKCVVMIQNWWDGHRAAVSKIRLYEVEGKLPPLAVPNMAKDPRFIGVYCEDANGFRYNLNLQKLGGASPADQWNRGFGYLGQLMSHSGQNLFHFPVYWYGGSQYDSKVIPPRAAWATYGDILRAWLLAAQQDGYKMLFNVTPAGQSALQFEIASDLEEANRKGWLQMSGKTDKLTPCSGNVGIKSGHHPKLKFLGDKKILCQSNPLHPKFEKLWWEFIDEIVTDNAQSPALAGLSIRLTGNYASFLCFQNIESGYEDFTVGLYEKEKGIKIPFAKDDPKRFSKRYQWLMENRKDDWIQWRCDKLTPRLIKTADYLQKQNPDLKLYLDLYELPAASEKEYLDIYRGIGIDLEKMAGHPGIVMLKRVSPNYDRQLKIEYRGKGKTLGIGPEEHYKLRELFENHSQDRFATGAFCYNKYYESLFSRSSRKPGKYADKIKARDVQLGLYCSGHGCGGIQDTGRRFLRAYTRELARLDAKTLMTGGWGLEILGREKELQEFSKAYLTLENANYIKVENIEAPVTVRERKANGKLSFYVINESEKPIELSLKFSATVKVKELTNNKILQSDSNGLLKISLKPYSLRSFRLEGNPIKIESGIVKKEN